ncbi:MAG: hypothetical protein ACREXP_00015 [Steroidobacteraceae bacterium]
MSRYTLEYRISTRHKWRALSVSALSPFTGAECANYRQQIADRQAPKFVPRHAVELRMLRDGEVCAGKPDAYQRAITGEDTRARDKLIAGLKRAQ